MGIITDTNGAQFTQIEVGFWSLLQLRLPVSESEKARISALFLHRRGCFTLPAASWLGMAAFAASHGQTSPAVHPSVTRALSGGKLCRSLPIRITAASGVLARAAGSPEDSFRNRPECRDKDVIPDL